MNPWQAAFERYGVAPEREADWRPSPDDCLRLLTAVTIAHGEPGFTFESPAPDLDAETRFHRDGLINYFLAHPERGKAATVKDAAASTAKAIDKGIRAGDYTRHDTGELTIRKKGDAGWIERDYGGRRRGRAKAVKAAAGAVAERQAAAETRLAEAIAGRDAAGSNGLADAYGAHVVARFANMMAESYSELWKCRQAIEAAGQEELPPFLRGFRDEQAHSAELLNALVRFTSWPADASGYGDRPAAGDHLKFKKSPTELPCGSIALGVPPADR